MQQKFHPVEVGDQDGINVSSSLEKKNASGETFRWRY